MTNQNSDNRADAAGTERIEDADELYKLGVRYSTGRDFQQDLVLAHKWLNLAAMMGHEAARLARAELAREMSQADIAEAQRQARAWLWDRAPQPPAGEASQPVTSIARTEKHLAPARRDSEPLCA